MYRFAPLRTLKNIFILIFFSGMLYTVFNYVPIIEEEVSAKKHEHSSQASDADDGQEGAEDEEVGTEFETIFHLPSGTCFSSSGVPSLFWHYINSLYLTPQAERCTPPPRPVA